MEIVLVVAVLIVAVAVLYVAATLGTRIRQSTAPLIDEAVKDIYGRIEDLKGQLNAIASELEQDQEQSRLEDRKIQGRLDHADSRMNSIANRILAELETIKRLSERGPVEPRLRFSHGDRRVRRALPARGHGAVRRGGGRAARHPARPGHV